MAHWVRDRRRELEALPGRVDVLRLDGGEAALLGGSADEATAVAAVLRGGVPWVVVKRGDAGAAAYRAGREEGRAVPVAGAPAVPVPAPVDPAGAGDAFAGGLVGTLAAAGGRKVLEPRGVADALRAGAALGARAVRSFSYHALTE